MPAALREGKEKSPTAVGVGVGRKDTSVLLAPDTKAVATGPALERKVRTGVSSDTTDNVDVDGEATPSRLEVSVSSRTDDDDVVAFCCLLDMRVGNGGSARPVPLLNAVDVAVLELFRAEVELKTKGEAFATKDKNEKRTKADMVFDIVKRVTKVSLEMCVPVPGEKQACVP